MRSLLLLLLISANAIAQIHKDSPLPVLDEESVKVINQNIIGWSKSLDGQWVSNDMTIPVMVISQNKEAYDTEVSDLGMDNISELRLYRTQFGEENLYTLVKISRSGYYRYPSTRQKWQSTESAYYYVFDANQVNKLKNVSDKTALIKIPLRDYGSLEDIKPKKIKENLISSLNVKTQTDRFLVATLKIDSEDADKIYFQLSSQHSVFPDVEGVLNDFELQGKTVYSSPLLLDYLHYEYSKDGFYNFFSVE